MRKLLLLGLLIANCQLLTVNSFAQAPKLMNYQGVARSVDGQTLVNKQINLRLSILSAVDITQAIYKEEQSVTTTEFGLFALKIGEGNPIKGSMADVDWGSADHFIAVELDAENNGHFEFMGTSQLLSVPYAFYAEKSGTAKDLENMDNLRTIDFSGTFGQTIRSNGSDWEASSLIYNSGSKIGIGNTSPSEILDVTGNVNVDGDLNLTRQNEITFDSRRALAMDENRNLMQGFQTGNSLTTGANNNLIGHQAGKSTTTGTNNSIIGYQAGLNNTTGDANIFYGYKSGYSNTTGSNNYFIGLQAGYNSTTGVNNVAMGTKAGYSLGDGKDNTFVGREAGYSNTGNRNSFIGKDAGRNNTTGFNNTYIGYNAYGVDTLENATAIGANTTVETSNSIVLGNAANVGVGTSAPSDKLHVVGNIRMVDGNQAAGYIPVSDSNGVMTWTSPSDISPSSLSDADNDTRILMEQFPDNDEIRFYLGGTQRYRMRANRLEVSNTGNSIFIGTSAGSSDDNTNNSNIGIGTSALDDNTSGENNIAMGYLSMLFNQTGSNNVAIGNSSLILNGVGSDNVAIGNNAMISASTSNDNTVIGSDALAALNLGSSNTAIGREALKQGTSGTRNTALGYQAGINANGLTNATAIGANTEVGCDSCLVLGDASNVGVGTTTPADKLHVVGNIRMVDGNQQDGYLLASDANGTASWQHPDSLVGAEVLFQPVELCYNEDVMTAENTTRDVDIIASDGGTVWQSFTPASTGQLKTLTWRSANSNVPFSYDPAVRFQGGTLKIYEGEGLSGTLIHSQGVGTASINPTWVTYNLYSQALQLNQGQLYTFSLTEQVGRDGFHVKASSTNLYPGGICGQDNSRDLTMQIVIEETYCDDYQMFEFDNGVVSLNQVDSIVFGDSTVQSTAYTDNQTLSINGDTLSIDNGNSIVLPNDNDWTVSGNDQYSAVSGNVGIGTTAPAHKLDVPSSTSNEVVAHFGQANIANKGTLNFHILNDNLEGYNVGFGQNSGGLTTIGSHNHDIEFFTDSAATKEVMRIYNDGRAYVNYNFGFGTNNPGLQVSIGTSGTGIQNDGSNNLQIYNSSSENARFSNTGNLGIGTNNPRAALHVTEVGTGFSWSPFSQTTGIFERATGSLLTIVSSNTGVSSVVMGDADSQFNGRVRYEHTDDRMEFWTANTEKVSILSNGNVGIGSNTPAEKLDVAGSIRMVDGNQQVGYIPVSDANGTMAWADPNSITSAINDADSDTKIQVEESADEDKIRFDIAGAENFRMEDNSFYLNSSSALVSPTINFYNSSLNFTSSIASTITNPPFSNASYYLQFKVKGSNALRLDGNGAVTISGNYTLPTTDGADGEVLTTDGSGIVSWAFPLTMADADNDTKIQVEESADEDMIRFDLAGSEAFRMRSNANGYPLLEIPVGSEFSTFFGYTAGEASANSEGSTFIGCFAGRSHTDGDFNTAIGATAGRDMTSASNNTLLGASAGMRATTSSNNTLVGASSGFDAALGSDNVMIGYRAGYNTEGAGNVFIGYSAGENETGSQKLYIENSTSSSPLIYGEFDNDILAFNANVGIGTTSPGEKLDVNGNAIVNGELDVKGQTTTDSIKVGSGGTVMTKIFVHSVAYDLPNMDGNSNIIRDFSVPGAEVGDLVFVSPDGKLDESVVIATCWVKETDVVEVKFRNTDDASFGNGEVPERNYRFLVIKQ